MKKAISLILLAAFIVTSLLAVSGEAAAKKKKKRRRQFARIHRVLYKPYQEYCLSPAIKFEDEPVIIDSLKEKGVDSVKVDETNNSLVLHFNKSALSALDIMQALKDLGYKVTTIN